MLLITRSLSAQDTPDYETITVDNISGLQLNAVAGRDRITDLAWSPDNATVAVTSTSGLWLYNPFDLTQVPKRLDSHILSSVAYSDDGMYLAIGAYSFASQFGDFYGDNILKVWNLRTGEIHLDTDASIISMLFFPNKNMLLTLNNTGGIELWDIKTNERIIYSEYLVPGGSSVGYGDIVLSISPDGKYFSAGSLYPNNKTYIWATQAVINKKLISLDTAEPSVYDSSTWRKTQIPLDTITSPDGKLLASVTQNYEKLTVVDAKTQSIVSTLAAHVEISFYYYDDNVKIWYARNMGLRNIVIPSEQSDSQMLYSPNGKLLASVTSNHEIFIWDTSTGLKSATYKLRSEYADVSPLAFTSDNHYLFAVAFNNTRTNFLTAIDLITNEIVAQIAIGKSIVNIATSPDDLSLAINLRSNESGSNASEIQIWSLSKIQSEDRVQKSWKFDSKLSKIEYVTNDLLVFERGIGNQMMTLSTLDIETGHETSIDGQDGTLSDSLYSLTVNPDRTLLAVATQTGIRFWNLNTMRELKRVDTDRTIYVSFSNDGKSLISVHGTDLNGEIRVWRVPSSKK